VDVLEHNRLDLVSLAGLAARLLYVVDGGATRAVTAGEALGLGHVYDRVGRAEEARMAFERALALGADRTERLEALRGLAVSARRGRLFDRAAEYWRLAIETPGCSGALRREAAEALAIHHEHRQRDLETAREFALESLASDARASRRTSAQHRLARIERKLGGRQRVAAAGFFALAALAASLR
jgi:tetratricopeptide (TPR) repeat protein